VNKISYDGNLFSHSLASLNSFVRPINHSVSSVSTMVTAWLKPALLDFFICYMLCVCVCVNQQHINSREYHISMDRKKKKKKKNNNNNKEQRREGICMRGTNETCIFEVYIYMHLPRPEIGFTLSIPHACSL
jgi:hypothetical protein